MQRRKKEAVESLNRLEGPRFPRPGKTPREDSAAVMKFYGLAKSFPPAVLAEARRVVPPDRERMGGSGGRGKDSASTGERTCGFNGRGRDSASTGETHRLDLRKKFIFTCDPVTARDYDDAISLEKGRGGTVVLGVHIADVSHYVRPGTALDREAYKRSTSVYLADRVVPMLPEELSNGVCSLVPNEDRYAFSVFMTFDAKGTMVKRAFAKSVIRSQARFTYEQVMRIIVDAAARRVTADSLSDSTRRDSASTGDAAARRVYGRRKDSCSDAERLRVYGDAAARRVEDGRKDPCSDAERLRVYGDAAARRVEDGRKDPCSDAERLRVYGGRGEGAASTRAAKTILAVHRLAQKLRANRFAAGALDLEMPEAEVMLDAEGEMTGIVTRPYDESHQMIEECMVAANEAVAKELWTRGVKILARLHEPPDPEKLMMLRAELRGLGIKVGDLENQKVFAQFLQTIKRHPLYPTLAMMVLRSMKRAVYDAGAIGHFGLAKKYYAHFTSPIRRYPDLTLHRQLADYLSGGRGTDSASTGDAAARRVTADVCFDSTRRDSASTGDAAARRVTADDSFDSTRRDSASTGGNTAKAKRPPSLLAKWAEHTTEREEIATEAERALVEIKKFRLMERELSSRQILDYDAVIVKCTPFGCFVEIPETGVSGLVHISLLSRKFVRFNESDQSLSAPGGGSWKLGDRLKVHIARVDFDNRRLDFVPVREPERRSRTAIASKRRPPR